MSTELDRGTSDGGFYNLSNKDISDDNTFTIQSYRLPPGNIDPYAVTNGIVTEIQKFYDDPLAEVGDIFADIATGTISAGVELLTGQALNTMLAKLGDYMNVAKDIVKASDDGTTLAQGASVNSFWKVPIPNNLTDRISHQFDSDILSYEELMMKKAPAYLLAKMIPSVIPGKDALMEKYKQGTKLAFDLAKRQGITIDPNLITTYKNTDIREFNFVINILPINAKNAREIIKGILALKAEMTGVRETLVLKQEYIFKVKFQNKRLQEYLWIDDIELNLSRVDIDIGSDGSMQLYHDGTPKHMQLSLTFQERRPLRTEITVGDVSEAQLKVVKSDGSGDSKEEAAYVASLKAATDKSATGIIEHHFGDSSKHITNPTIFANSLGLVPHTILRVADYVFDLAPK